MKYNQTNFVFMFVCCTEKILKAYSNTCDMNIMRTLSEFNHIPIRFQPQWLESDVFTEAH